MSYGNLVLDNVNALWHVSSIIYMDTRYNKHTQTHTHWLVDEHWEKELEAELQDFELVEDEHQATGGAAASADWEKDVDDLLGDCEDLK